MVDTCCDTGISRSGKIKLPNFEDLWHIVSKMHRYCIAKGQQETGWIHQRFTQGYRPQLTATVESIRGVHRRHEALRVCLVEWISIALPGISHCQITRIRSSCYNKGTYDLRTSLLANFVARQGAAKAEEGDLSMQCEPITHGKHSRG